MSVFQSLTSLEWAFTMWMLTSSRSVMRVRSMMIILYFLLDFSIVSFIAVCPFYRKHKNFSHSIVPNCKDCIGVFRDWVQRSFQNKYENYPWTFFFTWKGVLSFVVFCCCCFVCVYFTLFECTWLSCGCVLCMYVCLDTTIDCCSIVILWKLGYGNNWNYF